MNIFLIGNNGQLGWELHRSLLPLGNVRGVNYPEIDLADKDNIVELFDRETWDWVINAAAFTDVDRAEEDEKRAEKINAVAPGILAQKSKSVGAVFIHFSTDYVFNGRKGGPYVELDEPDPINAYGETKLAGERAVERAGGQFFIFRTSWLYSLRRDCFVTKVLSWARKKENLRIVSDQIGSPTWSRTLAEVVAQAIVLIKSKGNAWVSEKSGIYHVAGRGNVSRYEWAKKILQHDPNRGEQVVKTVNPAHSDEFETAAKRPRNSSLDTRLFQATFNMGMSDWLTSLKIALSTFYHYP